MTKLDSINPPRSLTHMILSAWYIIIDAVLSFSEKRLGISCGCYRAYWRVPGTRLGLKFAIPGGTNILSVFLTGISMNLLERKRYRYYGKVEPMVNWGMVWTPHRSRDLCPTYLTLGLINLVKHLQPAPALKLDDRGKPVGVETFGSDVMKASNFGIDEAGRILQLDYGEFTTLSFSDLSVTNLDYR